MDTRTRRTLSLSLTLVIPLGILLWFISLFPPGPPGTVASLPPVHADGGTVITVTTDADSGAGSLRYALVQANNDTTTATITITFDADYTITLNSALPSLVRNTGPTIIQGDRGTGSPRTVIDASALVRDPSTGGFYSGLRVTGDHWVIQGMVIIGDVGDNFGITLRGDHNEVRNCYIGVTPAGTPGPNYTGILVTAGAGYNIIDGNVIGDNTLHGLSLYSTYSVNGDDVTIYPSHHNTVTNNYIGTTPGGADVGNGGKGIIIQRGSHDNYVADNQIAYNRYHGIYLYGGTDYTSLAPAIFPPTGNRIINNTLTANENGLSLSLKRGALVNDRTHLPISNTMTTLTSGFDNIIAGNLISGNQTAGIYNVGASPLISGNRILNNQNTSLGYGIYNIVYFGADDDPATADDDILSVPYIVNNTIDGNSSTGIISLDTAPARRYELTTTLHNTIGINGLLDVDQVWYAGVEVLTGTVTNTVPLTNAAAVYIWKGDMTNRYNLEYYDLVHIVAGTLQFDSVIWNDDEADTYEHAKTWPQVREFTINLSGTLDSWMTHTVQVDFGTGFYTGTVIFPFDGMTSTKPSPGGTYAPHTPQSPLNDVFLPSYRYTSPYARYQIAEVNFTYDSDQDSIPDVVEGDTDSDGDGTPDYQDTDSDNDGIPDDEEGAGDTDGDGIPDYQDLDSDGDGIPDENEYDNNGDGVADDTDGDGIPDFQDPDDDGDGIPTSDEDVNGNGDPTDDDTDGDGIPDYQDPDDDGDGVPTDEEYDNDGDGVPDDTDGDGIPDYQDPDDDGDGVPTSDEDVNGNGDPTDDDTDGDGIPDYQDPDDDNDGIPTGDEDVNGNGDPTDDDTDGDGIPDYLDDDDDGDTVSTEQEAQTCTQGDDNCVCDEDDPPNCYVDSDGDGIPDYQDSDDDGDTVSTDQEAQTCTLADDNCVCDEDDPPHCYVDTDDDGIPDYLDNDDDGDTVSTDQEAQTCTQGDDNCVCDADDPPHCYLDTDGDTVPDYLDNDDDGDGLSTADEAQTCTQGDDNCACDGSGHCYVDSDDDGIPDYLDADDDNDSIPTDVEADWCGGDTVCDLDGDGIPDYLDTDSDGDGIPDADEYAVCQAGDPHCVCDFGSPPGCYIDSDDDGMPDWLDGIYVLYLPIVTRNY